MAQHCVIMRVAQLCDHELLRRWSIEASGVEACAVRVDIEAHVEVLAQRTHHIDVWRGASGKQIAQHSEHVTRQVDDAEICACAVRRDVTHLRGTRRGRSRLARR